MLILVVICFKFLVIINDLLGDLTISDTKLNGLSFHFWYTVVAIHNTFKS